VAEHLPESVTIETFYFDRKKLELRGSASSEDAGRRVELQRGVAPRPQPQQARPALFSEVTPPNRDHGEQCEMAVRPASSRRPAMNNFLNQLNLTPQERRIVVGIIFLVVIVVLNLLFVWPHFGEWGSINKQL
jgi:hypothetical protein